MRIHILELIEGAKRAVGLTVIIDVFRAFSTAAYVMEAGAREILPVDTVERAFAFKRRFPEAVLIGERGGRKVPGFDYGNSPKEMLDGNFSGKLVIQTTGAGTQGVVYAEKAHTIIGGSFPMSGAIVRYIHKWSPREVSLVAMGTRGRIHSDEDTLFASYLKRSLQGERVPSQEEIYRGLRECESAQKFFNPDLEWAPQEDYDLCLAADRFPFVLELRKSSVVEERTFQKILV